MNQRFIDTTRIIVVVLIYVTFFVGRSTRLLQYLFDQVQGLLRNHYRPEDLDWSCPD